MQTPIPTNHYLYQAKYAVNEILSAHSKMRHNAFFAYGKFYKNGTVNLLTNCPELFNYALKMQYPFTCNVPKNLISKQFCYLLEHEKSYEKVLTDCKKMFNVYHPIDFFNVVNDYYEMFCFGMDLVVQDPANIYLNCLDRLNAFCSIFRSKAARLIEKGEKDLIYLPSQLRSNLHEDFLLIEDNHIAANDRMVIGREVSRSSNILVTNNQEIVKFNKAEIQFSRRESECVSYLCEGLSYKEIGRRLNISDRTVEYYINMAKQKAHCKKQTELIAKFLNFT